MIVSSLVFPTFPRGLAGKTKTVSNSQCLKTWSLELHHCFRPKPVSSPKVASSKPVSPKTNFPNLKVGSEIKEPAKD